MISLGDPSWISWAWGSLALFILFWIFDAWLYRRLRQRLGSKIGAFLTASLSLSKRHWHLFLQCATLGFFALALARPLLGLKQQEVKQTGVEMIIAVDVSNSMLAEDDKPSRLEHAKHEISHLMDLLGSDRVGLIAFAGSAVLVSPLTMDPGAIKLYLASLSPDSVSTQGTNFKAVMDEAIQAFDRGGVETPSGAKPTRVLLLASDGEDNEPGGLIEVKKAADQGIHLFALGFGSARGAPIPLRDERGNLKGYKKDRSNQAVMSIPSDQGLAKLASTGRGGYFHATFDESELKNLVADLDRLEKVDFKTRMSTEYDEKFQIPLCLALFFAFFDLLFGDRRRQFGPWRGRFVTTALGVLLVLFGYLPARAFGPPSIEANNTAVKKYHSEEYQEAFNGFADALSKDPYNPHYHFNLGDVFYKSGEYGKAMSEYEAAESQPKAKPDLKFQAMFNAGNAAVTAKDIPKALHYYQKALNYRPDSVETKTNIELAIQEQQNQGGGGNSQNQQNQKNQQNQNDQKNKQDQNDQQKQGQDKNDKGQQPTPQPSARPTPRDFKSQALNESDVRRILEELKRQEQEIRARQDKLNNRVRPERPIEKDW